MLDESDVAALFGGRCWRGGEAVFGGEMGMADDRAVCQGWLHGTFHFCHVSTINSTLIRRLRGGVCFSERCNMPWPWQEEVRTKAVLMVHSSHAVSHLWLHHLCHTRAIQVLKPSTPPRTHCAPRLVRHVPHSALRIRCLGRHHSLQLAHLRTSPHHSLQLTHLRTSPHHSLQLPHLRTR